MTYTCIMGLDPGASGAVAFYYPEKPLLIAAYDVPLVDKRINPSALSDLIRRHGPDLAVVEIVHAMPKQGVSSSFNFGVSYGMALGIIGALKIPVVSVSPTKWKKYFGLSADKEEARALAISKWPASEHFRRKKDDGRAEAALLALYGAKTQG
jgi:hypothetical protein